MKLQELVLLLSLFASSVFFISTESQSLPPAKLQGFVYGNHAVVPETIAVMAFLDPICPDSRDAWKPLKQAADYYGHLVRLVVHPFPLPYHDNAFFASRALQIVNIHNTTAAFHLFESFFNHQEKFYNAQTRSLSRDSIIKHIVKFASESVGNSLHDAIKNGFDDRKTDLKTRLSFKYGGARGVYGTPFFFVNGFLLSDAETPTNYSGWRKLIDSLLSEEATTQRPKNRISF